jgi:DNA-binding CsgD family transcriptional regulator
LIQALHGQQTVDVHFRAPLQQARSHALTPRSGHSQEADLSSRERELIQLLGRGHNATQIAALQQKRRDTIRRQLSLLYRKTGVSDQRGLIAWSIAQGLIRPLDLVAAAPPAASEPGFPAADGNRRRNLATHH